MESFCHSVENPKIANDLIRSLSGKGAFRRFRDAIRRHGIEDAWYRFKDGAQSHLEKGAGLLSDASSLPR